MRLTIILILSAVLTLNAANAAQSKRVSLNLTGVSFSTLFEEIRKQTNQSFFFNEAKIAELDKISVNKTDVPLTELLNEVLSGTGLSFKYVDGVIVIVDQDQQQETMTINGTVVDAASSQPLPGVTIVLKGSKLGAVTDFNGKFVVKLPKKPSILVFSYVGFTTKEVEVSKTSEVVVQMEEDVQGLDEVVIYTGYQEIEKNKLTSAVSEVKGEELDMIGEISVDRMLDGKAPGLNITNVSATPGAATKIRVRSGSTFTGNQSPLWVVDGIIYEDPVPLSAEQINSFDNVNIIGNALSGINPTDIAKIDILKDASATAIYGTRAANGVIVITTKRGTKGKPALNYSGGFSFVQAPSYNDFDLMNSMERIDVSREMYERNLGYTGFYQNVDRLGYEGALQNLWDGTYTQAEFDAQVKYLETLNTNWFGELFQNSYTQRHSVSASGGSDTSRYYFSLGYDDQQGTEKNVGLNRITARSNMDLDLRDNVTISLKFSGSVQKGQYNHQSINYFNQAYNTSRTIPLYDENGDYFYTSREIYRSGAGQSVFGGYNIFNEADNSERNVTNKDLNIAVALNWDFLENFRLRTQASYRSTTNMDEQWITEDTHYIAKLRTYEDFNQMVENHFDIAGLVPFGGIYNAGMVSQDAYTLTNQLNYNVTLGGHHTLNFNLGNEVRSAQYWGATGFAVPGYNHFQGRGFIALPRPRPIPVPGSGTSIIDFENYPYDAAFNWLTPFGGQNIYPNITDRLTNSFSVFAIANYVYKNKYVLNFNARSDGSNRFGQYERYKFKPAWSTSARWNIHEESFMKDVMVVDELALRASFGVRGTMPNASPYMIISGYGNNNVLYYPENTANLNSFPNANLRWEKSQTANFGVNYSLLGGKISGALDYAYSKSTDLLLTRPISNVNGTDTQLYNAGGKDVNSFELSIRTRNINTKNFGWNTRLNFSHDRDRVTNGFEGENNLTVGDYLSGSIYRAGFPTYGFFSYQFDGLTEDGLPTFKHLVEEEMTAGEQLEKMLVYEGSRIPKFYGGFGTEFRFGNFNLSANFTYKLAYKTRLLPLYDGNQNLPLPYENMNSIFDNRWRQPGDELITDIPAISNHNQAFTGAFTADGYSQVYVTNMGKVVPDGQNTWWMYDRSDARVVDASHIRLQSLTLAYTLPTKLLEGSGIKRVRLSAQGSNLGFYTFDSRLSGQDPEQVRNVGMPVLPNYSFSLNMSF
ncbi:SusC/RagA family TonB-linked outer membrane protein [Aestuariibaculum sediminum]|uniref:SusC/RagA family TonB-linked outer membrane protein n=1 Tax=Aestuariibaculum sediminum TaxID=2770637 RepID=A0A8J6PXF4_9FLAO|nr:SusC/RagA family TonB-linked outer membrane protein [Aestuariibaculum sediminum]MBD0830632.1 SusC/RagA family TonB-linked outer membrane protein [Aestuariibaculum sediminum]